MIKINLLSEGRSKVAKPRSSTAVSDLSGEPANLWLIGVAVLGLLVIGGRYFLLHSEIETKNKEIATIQKEVDELRPIIREVEQFEARKAELEHKIAVINTLKDNQKGPVRIMDQVSGSLPEMLWLTRMQSRGNGITLNGQAFHTNAAVNFIDNLDQVEEFAEPVLKDMTFRKGVYNFVVTFTFDPSAAKTNQPRTDQGDAGDEGDMDEEPAAEGAAD